MRTSRPREKRTWTDDAGICHDVRNGYAFTRCDLEVPSDRGGAMPGWPAPFKSDRVPGTITCVPCVAMRDS